jgi:hypothetical protein
MSEVVMTNADILIALRTFSGPAGKKDVPNVKANYALTKARRKLQEAAKDLDTTRVSLCEQHSAKNEDGSAKRKTVKNEQGADVEGYDITDEAAFAKDYNALLEVSVTLEGVRAVTTDELGGAMFTNDELFGLGALVTE